MDWYTRTVRDASVNAVATRAGVVQTTLARQLKTGTLSAETVLAVARGYDADAIGALIACGYLRDDDVRRHGAEVALARALDIELAAEVVRRLPDGAADQPLR